MSAPTATPSTQPETIFEQSSQDMHTDLPPPPGSKPLSTIPENPPVEQLDTTPVTETETSVQPVEKPLQADDANLATLETPSEEFSQPQQSTETVPNDTQQPISPPLTTLPPPPQKPRPSKWLLSDTTSSNPPVSSFSKSRNSLPPIRLMPTIRNSFTLPSKATNKPVTKNSRTAFLTAALSPSFVSAKPLHTRAHSTISEIVGNLAPERYLSLPPRSSAAAKALLATSVCKELRDVHKLETIRRRHGDVEGNNGWFDYVLDSLGDAGKLRPHVDRLKNFAFRPWEGLVNRVEFLPLESIRIDSVMGHDITPFVRNDVQHLNVSKGRAEAVDSKIQRMKNAIKVQTSKTIAEKKIVTNVSFKPAKAPLPKPVDDAMDDDLFAPPVPNRDVQTTTTPAPKPKPSTASAKSKSVPSTDVVMIDDDEPMQPVTNENVQKPRVQVPVFLVFDDANKKVSLDFDIREIPSKPTSPVKQVSTPPVPAAPATKTAPAQTKKRERTGRDAVKAKPTPAIQTPTSVKPFPARLSGTDHGNLDDLLGGLDNDILPPKEAEKAQNSDPEVVLVEGTKAPTAPKSTQRRTKRKRADKTQEQRTQERIELEQRASRMRSAVVSALQEDPDTRRQRNARPSAANGHPKAKKKLASSGRRMSRRSKKNSAPILDSSGSDKEYRQDRDDDFAIDADDIIEVLPVHKTNGTRAAPPDLSPPKPKTQPPGRGRELQEGVTEIESLDGSDMASPRIGSLEHKGRHVSKKVARTGGTQYARMHRGGGSSSRRERHRHFDEETHEGEPELWNREVLKVERLLEESNRDSDPLLNQIHFNPYRFYEQVPIIRRVIQASKAQHGNLVDMDKVDEHEEMSQFYADRRNERSYNNGNGCSGTEFLEHVFQQTERERLNAMHGYAGEETNNTSELNDERLDLLASGKGIGVVNLDGNGGHSSSASQDSSDASSESSEEEVAYAAGSKRSRSQARSRASKARELQSRVCGDLLATMTNESKRRVLRWAERDFTWFDKGADVMEIVASRAYKRCNRCDTGRGDEENCEESILLKLWKDMSWRKVRRMRHRSSNTS